MNTTGASSGAGTAYPSGAQKFTHVYSGVRVTRSVVLCVCFVDRCLSFCTFSFGHCVVSSSPFTESDYTFGIFKLFFLVHHVEEMSLINITEKRDLGFITVFPIGKYNE